MVAWKQYIKSFASFFELSIAPNIAEIIKLRLARLQYFIQFTYEIE